MTDPQSGGWAQPGQPSPGQGPPGWNQQGYPPPPAPPPQAPKPGVIPLRPLGVGEVLDGAISYIRANPLVTLGLAALVITLSQIVQVPAQYLYFDEMADLGQSGSPTASEVASAIGGGASAGLLSGAVQFVAGTVLTGMLIVVLSRAVLGWRTDLPSAWASVRSRIPGLLGLSLLTGLLLLAPLVAAVLPIVVLAAAGAPTALTVVAGILMGIAAVCAMIYLWVSLAMAAPAYILEQVGVVAALSRSRHLARPAWWRLFGILLLGAVIAGVIGSIIAIPFGVGGFAISSFSSGDPASASTGLGPLVLGAIGTIIAGTITSPFTAGITGLVYFDQRIRREGWDLELARAAQGSTAPQQPASQPPAPGAPPPHQQPPYQQPPQGW